MMSTLIRFGSIGLLIGLAVLVVGLTWKSNSSAKGGQQIEVQSFAWGINQTQLLRICVGDVDQASRPRESVSLVFAKIQNQSGDVILDRELAVPRGHFRCTDFTYSQLLAAGLVPEASTRVQFMVTVGINESVTVGAAQTITVGAAETINVGSGETVTYNPFITVDFVEKPARE